jgi:perosamine synthetase
MTTGDGGMICSNDPELLKEVRAMRWVGIDKDNWKTASSYTAANQDAMHWFYEINVLGYKYNMNDLAASIGLVQLSKLNDMNEKRSKIISQYIDSLNAKCDATPLLPYEPMRYVYQMFGVRVQNKDRLIVDLKNKGIATGCHYTPLSLQPLFSKWGHNCPYIESEVGRMVTLPLHTGMAVEDVDYISHAIKESIKR